MYSFDNLSSSLGCISSVSNWPVSRGRHRKLLDDFSHESDIMSLQDPFTSRPYKTPFYFYYCVPRKIPRGILFQIHVEYSPSSRHLVSDHCSLRHRVKDYVSLVAVRVAVRVAMCTEVGGEVFAGNAGAHGTCVMVCIIVCVVVCRSMCCSAWSCVCGCESPWVNGTHMSSAWANNTEFDGLGWSLEPNVFCVGPTFK